MQFNKEDQSSIFGAISIKTNSNLRFTMDSYRMVPIKPCKVKVRNLPVHMIQAEAVSGVYRGYIYHPCDSCLPNFITFPSFVYLDPNKHFCLHLFSLSANSSTLFGAIWDELSELHLHQSTNMLIKFYVHLSCVTG